MKKMKFMSILAVGSMFLTTAIPALALEITGGSDIVFISNSSSPSVADWLVTYPKEVTITDDNLTADNGRAMKFKLYNKLAVTDYTGADRVGITIPTYTTATGIALAQTGVASTAALALTTSTKVEVADGTTNIMELSSTKVEDQGYAYLKTKSADASGTYKGIITFKFLAT